jgi:hypothetical protein
LSGRGKWVAIAVVGLLLTAVGAVLVVGPREGICKPPLLELGRDTDPGGEAVRIDLVDGATDDDRRAVRQIVREIDGVDGVGTLNRGQALRITGDDGSADAIIAAVSSHEKVESATEVSSEDARLVKCQDDAKTQLAIGAPVLIVGLAALVFGAVRFLRARAAAETVESAPSTTE